jgi:1,4-dihydroxy-6-naphthoate synthase
VTRPLRIGLSTCPNDTFLFHALLEGIVRVPFELEFVLGDVEELNQRMLAGELELSKTSLPALFERADSTWVLPVGTALGYGVGPVVLAAPGRALALPLEPPGRFLLPGRWTTAALLFRLFAGELVRGEAPVEHRVFSAILCELRDGSADYGACIHEARFTWREHGLGFVVDLGQLYETRAGAPLPLGGLCVARRVGREQALELARALRHSLEWALANRHACLPTLRRHAQEHSDEVLWAHVDLYVNAATLDLGPEGRRAYRALHDLAVARGLAPSSKLAFL